MPGASHESAAQEFSVAIFPHNLPVRALVLDHNESVAGGVQREDGNVNVPVVHDVLLKVFNSVVIRANPRGILEGIKIGIKAEASLLVERDHLITTGGMLQLTTVVYARVPGDVALRAEFQLGAKRESKRKVDHLRPKELVRLLAGKIVGRRLRGKREKPSRCVRKSGGQGEARATLGSRLGRSKDLLGKGEVAGRVSDIDELKSAAAEKSLKGECRIECGIPRGNSAGKHATHGERRVETIRVTLDQAGGNHATQRMTPCNGPLRCADRFVKNSEDCNLVGQSLLHGPSGCGVGRAGEGEPISQHEGGSRWIGDGEVLRRISTSGNHITVAI